MKEFDCQQRLAVYLALREALGFSNHAVRLLLRDFVNYLERNQLTPPIRARWAVDWACESAAQRGVQRLEQRWEVMS